MNAALLLFLAWTLTGAAPTTPLPTTARAMTPAVHAPSVAGSATVTVHRCVTARGQVTLQGDPCPKGSRDDARQMLRPKDPAPRERLRPAPASVVAMDEAPPPLRRELVPPPPMYRCTTYDGDNRFSESYDPNPRCEPLVIYYPYPNNLTPAQALSCRWVQDSCVRLTDQASCNRWTSMRKDAVSQATRAFSDTADYRKSELARISQIVDESCP